jgi:hypothetical protein
MSAILYPVAASAEEAVARPIGRAARAREAARLAARPVRFVTEDVGPAFGERDAALDAYAGRVDDPRPGRAAIAEEDRYCVLVERLLGAHAPAPAEPVFVEGRRWPKPPVARPATMFRLSVSFWKVQSAEASEAEEQARQLRRRGEAARLDASQLRALASQPLRPVKPQQPLDVGLFETPLPEAPDTLIPDE